MTEIKYKSEYKGKGGIIARVVAHSKSAYSGKEIVTFEYEAPKCILAEINTHRLFSRNAQSSRAVPIAKVIEGIRNNPVVPIYWGSNQAGMVAGEEIDTSVFMYAPDGTETEYNRDYAWLSTANDIANLMQAWENAGYHKQIVNRIGEAFTMIKGVITATEFDNFFHLRRNAGADPFAKELADCMWEALQLSEAEVLYEGEWHTPYVEHIRGESDGVLCYLTKIYEPIGVHSPLKVFDQDVERAKQISAAATAQVSFRKLDLSDETVDRVYSRLIDQDTPHGSCLEHQATPIQYYQIWDITQLASEEGASHLDIEGNVWSGNFKHFTQNRKLLPNEAVWEYKGL